MKAKWYRIIPIILNIIEKISLFFAYISGAFTFFMMVIIGYDVVMRHVFDNPTIWADEISCYLLVGITFLGAAYTLHTGGHIYVETLVTRLNPKIRKVLEFITDILSLLFLIVLTRQAYWLVHDSLVNIKISATLLRTPLYLPQLFLAIGLTWFSMQLIVHVLRRMISDHQREQAKRAG